jgi:hypothetical protein
MFEKATRLKLRFTHKGLCTVEDLWDIPLESLDRIFKDLNIKLKAQKEESLLETRSKEDEILDLKISIVKHIVEVRLSEQKARTDLAAKSAKKQKLLGIIAEKQDNALRDMSVDELTKLVDDL